MAKVFNKIQQKNRIKNNLLSIQSQKEKEVLQISQKLKQKMDTYQQKRQKKFNQKLQTYKLNDEKWIRKIQSIESKFRSQNKEAMQKAQKYRLQSQKFWRNKEVKLTTSRGKSFQKFNMNKTQQIIGKNGSEMFLNLPNDKAKQRIRNKSSRISIKFDSLYQPNYKSNLNTDRSQISLKNSRNIDINEQISKRQQKSEKIQKQKQMIILQNAMKRMAKIQQSRKKAQKLKQPSITPAQIRKPKNETRDNDRKKDKILNRDKSKSLNASKSKQSLLNQSIKYHIEAKLLLQQQKMKQRDKIVQNSYQKKRQQKILNSIKSKIQDIKIATIKNHNLQ